MSIHRQYGLITWSCDVCLDTLDTDTEDFDLARAKLADAGWITRRDDDTGKWEHFCSRCGEDY